MSALYAILSFLAAVAALVAGYRIWDKRSAKQPSDAIDSSSEAAVTLPDQTLSSRAVLTETSLPPPEASLAIAQPEPPQDLPMPAKVPLPEAAVTPPVIPDPWLDEPADEEASEVATAVGETEIPFPERIAAASGSGDPLNQLATLNSVDLSERILQLARSGQINRAVYLTRYANHADSRVRSAVATALGTLARNWRGTVVEALIPILGKLSQDTKAEVRLAAVEALGKIQSIKVLPWLQRAQSSSNSSVRKVATTALQQLKLNYYSKSALKPQSPIGKTLGKSDRTGSGSARKER
ncbi:MAG: HEAT repeat domain-containing protein [Kovacikia sp.]